MTVYYYKMDEQLRMHFRMGFSTPMWLLECTDVQHDDDDDDDDG